MSVRYAPVGWNRNKIIYDVAVLAAAVAFILLYIKIAPGFQDVTKPTSGAILRAQAFGTCAFLMLTFVLCIGPLARLDTALPAAALQPPALRRDHVRGGVHTRGQHRQHLLLVQPAEQVRRRAGEQHELRPLPRLPVRDLRHLRALPAAGARGDEPRLLAQVPDSVGLEGDSHIDLRGLCGDRLPYRARLTAGEAEPAARRHRGFERRGWSPACTSSPGGSSGRRIRNTAESAAGSTDEEPWVVAGNVDSVPDGRGIVVPLDGGERVAVFRYGDKLSALANVCAHQNGPLGEGQHHARLRDLPLARLPVPARGRLRAAALHREGRDLPAQARRPAASCSIPRAERARHLCRARAHRSPGRDGGVRWQAGRVPDFGFLRRLPEQRCRARSPSSWSSVAALLVGSMAGLGLRARHQRERPRRRHLRPQAR